MLRAFLLLIATSQSTSFLLTRSIAPPIEHALRSSSSSPPLNSTPNSSESPVNVLLCPAQFCVPSDYKSLLSTLSTLPHVSATTVAPLPRTEWIKVAKQLPTTKFWKGELDVKTTLSWYFQAIERGISDIYSKTNGEGNLCIIGHSIGGWVARAYLGGLSGSVTSVNRLAMDRTSSFITLGTPHLNGDGALVDQTRGLLTAVMDREDCSAKALSSRGIDVTCVGSVGVESKFISTKIDELVAMSSYFPLVGKWSARGDGIVPEDLAFMDSPARRVEIERGTEGSIVRHAHVLPTPWNLIDGYKGSIELEGELGYWYGSDGALDKWVEFIK